MNEIIIKRNLVDPASSHMLSSKIKPCMSKFKVCYCICSDFGHYECGFITSETA